MAPPILLVRIDDSLVRRRLVELQGNSKRLKPLLVKSGELLLKSTDDRWVREVAPSWEKWKPLAPSTLAQKRAQGRIMAILQSTGRLRSSIRAEVFGNTKLVLSTDVPYADKHPNRVFLGVSEEDAKALNQLAEDHVMGRLK